MATNHSPPSYSRWSRWHWNNLQAYCQVLIYSLGPTGFLNQENIPRGYVPPACADSVCYNRHQISAPVEGSEVNTFEQISMMATRCHLQKGGSQCSDVPRPEEGPCTVRSYVQGARVGGWGWGQGALYSEVQTITGNGYMGPPWTEWLTDGQTWLKTLPSRNLVGKKYCCSFGPTSKFHCKLQDKQTATSIILYFHERTKLAILALLTWEALLFENKIFSNKMLLSVRIEPGTSAFPVWCLCNWANLTCAS